MKDKEIIRDQEVKTEEINIDVSVEEDKEALAKMLGLSEEDEGESDASTDLTEGTEETNETDETEADKTEPEEDLAPLEDRFKEFEKEYEEPEQDPEDPETSLKKFETQIDDFKTKHHQNHFLNGLPDLRYKGQSVYQLTEDQFDEYLQDLRDQGKETQATSAAIARNKAVEQAKDWLQREDYLKQAEAEYSAARNQVEWFKVEKEWVKDLPELKPYLKTIDGEIRNKAASNPRFAAELETYNGKMKAVYSVVRELNLMEKISKDQPQAKIETPSAPDTKVVSKKVKTNTPGTKSDKVERIKSLSQREFERLSDKEIALALFEEG